MSEIKTLEIPKWGLSMEEGTIAQWLIQEGTQFSKGQEICEIETTKIVNVLEAPFDGLLRKIIANDGDTLVVGGIIAICADAQVSDAEVEAFAQHLFIGCQDRRRSPLLPGPARSCAAALPQLHPKDVSGTYPGTAAYSVS